MAQPARPGWLQILTRTGYYDQAHLINEFSYFTARAPPLLYQQQGESLYDFFYD